MDHDENVTPALPVEETALSPETGEEITPVEEAPVEEAPVEEAPVEEAPVEEVPVEEAPVEEAPVEEAPVEEAPVEEAPIEEAPTEEASAKHAPKQGKGKKWKLPSIKKGGIGLIVYALLLAACIVFLAVGGVFTGIGETFALALDAREEIGSFIEALRNADGDLLGGVLHGGEGDHDPDQIYNTGVLLRTAFDERSETVSVAHLNLTSDEFRAEVERFLFTNPRYFFVSFEYAVIYAEDTNIVTSVRFTYLYDEATTAQMNRELDEIVQPVIAAAPRTCDLDRVRYYHDYLIEYYHYDAEGRESGDAIRDVYRFFTEKKGVCQAYMQAMTLLCTESGIEAIPVVSEAAEHAWNLVRVDGNWYHVDVTQDDVGGSAPTPSTAYYNSYRYFLLSDAAIDNHDHREFRTWEKATDTRFDEAVWHRSRTPMLSAEGVHYFHVENTIYRMDADATVVALADLTQKIGGRYILRIVSLEGEALQLLVADTPNSEPTLLTWTLP